MWRCYVRRTSGSRSRRATSEYDRALPRVMNPMEPGRVAPVPYQAQIVARMPLSAQGYRAQLVFSARKWVCLADSNAQYFRRAQRR